MRVAGRHIVAVNRLQKKKTEKDNGSDLKSQPTPQCPELNSAVVGSVCRGANRIWRDYIAGEKLGAGAFSEVYRVRQKQGGRFFAAKKISKLSDNYHRESLEREISIMKEVDHPNCMRLVSVYDEPTACVLVLEIVKGSIMLDRLVAMLRVNPGCFYAEPVAAKVLEGCLSGLRCIHSMKIAHLDLKPENIMFVTDDEHSEFYNVVKLCDFGPEVVVVLAKWHWIRPTDETNALVSGGDDRSGCLDVMLSTPCSQIWKCAPRAQPAVHPWRG